MYGVLNPKIGGFYPQKGMVKIMENPLKMDDLGGKNPIFWVDTRIVRELFKTIDMTISQVDIYI